MRKKRPYIATLDQVRISKDGEDAIIEYVEPDIMGTHLKIGLKVANMTDHEILKSHNECIESQNLMREEYDHIPVEIPLGKPQIKYSGQSDQWVPRGDVLRCEISDGGLDGEATIYIDDHELSLREFGRLLTTYAGWGMRITFVPDDRVHEHSTIEVREPDNEPDYDKELPEVPPQ